VGLGVERWGRRGGGYRRGGGERGEGVREGVVREETGRRGGISDLDGRGLERSGLRGMLRVLQVACKRDGSMWVEGRREVGRGGGGRGG